MIVHQSVNVLDKGFHFCFVACFPAAVRTASQEVVNSVDVNNI